MSGTPTPDPSHVHFVAVYRKGYPGTEESHLPVVAWDEEGRPLVVGPIDGVIRRATYYGDFVCVDTIQRSEHYIVQVIPSDGSWHVVWGDGDSEPVIAWGLTHGGDVEPLFHFQGLVGTDRGMGTAAFDHLERRVPLDEGQ